MSLLVVSVATKPVMSDLIELEMSACVCDIAVVRGVLFELSQCVCVSCFDAGAVALRAGDFCIGAVVVAETVCCGGVLAEEIELVQDVGRNGYEVC